MLGVAFWKGGVIPPNSDTAIKVATSGGTVIGQLGFGYAKSTTLSLLIPQVVCVVSSFGPLFSPTTFVLSILLTKKL
jgi:hypothetical protein